jgi:hypothetical protein
MLLAFGCAVLASISISVYPLINHNVSQDNHRFICLSLAYFWAAKRFHDGNPPMTSFQRVPRSSSRTHTHIAYTVPTAFVLTFPLHFIFLVPVSTPLGASLPHAICPLESYFSLAASIMTVKGTESPTGSPAIDSANDDADSPPAMGIKQLGMLIRSASSFLSIVESQQSARRPVENYASKYRDTDTARLERLATLFSMNAKAGGSAVMYKQLASSTCVYVAEPASNFDLREPLKSQGGDDDTVLVPLVVRKFTVRNRRFGDGWLKDYLGW